MGSFKMKIRLSNCFWLVIPLLAWNIALAPKLTLVEVTSDAHSPAWLLAAENLTRIVVFAFPLLLALQVKDRLGKTGLAIYLVGILIYFASWIPLVWIPQSNWSQYSAALLMPRITPLLAFMGIALIGHSRFYAFATVVFIILHTIHGIQNLGV